jgi:glycosyltransferase involved in cell wall biosynthesis
VRGAYPGILALPDRWVSWYLTGVPIGLRMIHRLGIQAIVSTYPIATAHLIGGTLQRLSGLPWIADCRDSMTEDKYPAQASVRRSYLRIERRLVNKAAKVLFTTPSTLRMYAARYPQVPSAKWVCLPNGYDEENFVAAEQRPLAHRPRSGQALIVHSGIVYPKERDPTALLQALAQLRDRGLIDAQKLLIRLRASGNDAEIAALIKQFAVADLVELAPALEYHDALAEMLGADGLLVLQGASCNHQIPAKIYEYLRAGRPILGLADPAGDTGLLLAQNGVSTLAPLEGVASICATLMKFLQSLSSQGAVAHAVNDASAYSRRAQTAQLAALLDEVAQ